MAEKELELIEQYLRNELPEAERVAFEQKMAADAAFRHQVELHGRTVQAVRLKGRQALKDRLKERPKPVPGDWQAKRRRRLLVALLAVAALSVLWWKTGPRTANQKNPANTTTNQVDTVSKPPAGTQTPLDAKGKPSQTSPPSTKPPIAGRQMDTGKLFAAYFEAYKDETLDPSFRGSDDEATPFDRFQQSYWEGRHEAALSAFEELTPALKRNNNLLFQKANSLLAVGDPRAASAIFEDIIANGRSRFRSEAEWYLALSYLKMGEQGKADSLLKKLAADEKNARQSDAKKLLDELE
ncbi:MAG: hypothetical protein HY842_06970 [Bacteroidetes bacterium]|nr:hypothetical protein [Bacteroidota bacterium]